MIQTVSLSLFRFRSIRARLWVLAQMGAARLSLSRMRDVSFWKLCGSGTGEGFTPVPNTQVWAILAVWDSEEAARNQTQNSPVFKRWNAMADEVWTSFLANTSSRGHWSGQTPFEIDDTDVPESGPLAVLTRASIKLSAAPKFWGQEPAVSKLIGQDPNVMFKIGIGEIPWKHQVTFSIWPDTDSMAAFARRKGAHLDAIRAVREGDWFAEELYARFRVLGSTGSWEGQNPIQIHERTAA